MRCNPAHYIRNVFLVIKRGSNRIHQAKVVSPSVQRPRQGYCIHKAQADWLALQQRLERTLRGK